MQFHCLRYADRVFGNIEEIMEAFKEKDAQNREEIEQWICQKFVDEGLALDKKNTEKT